MAEATMRFSTKREIFMLPAPESKHYEYYKHMTQAGFYVRVSKPNAQGKVKRSYFHRCKVPNDAGELKQKWIELGLVEGFASGDVATKYEDAMRQVLEKRRQLSAEGHEGGSTRLTVGGAWAFYASEKHKNKSATKTKDEQQYKRYLHHLAGRYLDDLRNNFWTEYVQQLREGTLVIGQKERKDGSGTEPALLGPLADATLLGVLNTASVLYEIGNKYSGMQGDMQGTNPAQEAKRLLGEPNKRTSHIPLKHLGTAWRAADQLISPWWRDMFQVFVLTGLRRSLLMSMRFDEINFEQGIYVIDPRKPGTKRKGSKITSSTPNIRMPLSAHVLSILRARREFAPDQNGLVWFTPKPTRGRRTKKDAAALSDPRGAWTLIEGAIGDFHFTPHDLRRTFATAAMKGTRDMFAVSMLMLHTGEELARAANVPGITIRYIDTDEAVEQQREAAEAVTAYVLMLAALPVAEAAKIVEPALHQEIIEACEETA
jgi:integrase